jgi:NAD(P)-dependent dehydrogenase (short-subunit alcohol dehydrogenase family)
VLVRAEKKFHNILIFTNGVLFSGIGKETARDLAKRGAKVIIACRNIENGQRVADDLKNCTKNEKIIVKQLDLSSLMSVRQFAKEIKESEEKIDILVNNAGIGNNDAHEMTGDNLELTMQTNQFGPFLLTNLLLGEL